MDNDDQRCARCSSTRFQSKKKNAGYELSVLAAIVAAVGWVLMLYYNLRLKRSRDQSLITERYLNENGITYSAIGGEPPSATGFCYDREELIIFSLLNGYLSYQLWRSGSWAIEMNGSLTLHEHPGELVRLHCARSAGGQGSTTSRP